MARKSRVQFNTAGLIQVVKNAAEEGAVEFMEDVIAEAKLQVPVESGALRDSGRVRVTNSGQVIGEFTKSYAALQHENLHFRHKVGKAKYLEDPFNEKLRELNPTVVQKIRKFFKEVWRWH